MISPLKKISDARDVFPGSRLARAGIAAGHRQIRGAIFSVLWGMPADPRGIGAN
jgi:hypothetical protein